MGLMETRTHSCRSCRLGAYTDSKQPHRLRGSRISTPGNRQNLQRLRFAWRRINGKLRAFSLLFLLLMLMVVLKLWPARLLFLSTDHKTNIQMQSPVSSSPSLGDTVSSSSSSSASASASSIFSSSYQVSLKVWPVNFRSFALSYEQRINTTSSSKPKVTVMKETHRSSGYSHDVITGTPSVNPLGLSYPRLKIYVYDLPPVFNKLWLTQNDRRCSSHLFAAEVAIHERLLESPVRTMESSEADFFFVPVYLLCNFNTTSGFPSLSHARNLLASAVKHISLSMPYWNRSNGEDHIFVAAHDYGPCLHTMEDMAVAAGIPSFLRRSVILQTFGRTNGHACQAINHIHIPPFVQPPAIASHFNWRPEIQRRDIWAYFRGKVEINPKNISNRIYSRGIRSKIWHKYGRDRKFYIKRARAADYHSELRRSVFCLCPLGWAPWSPRIVEAVISGCVPVIIADEIALPFPHAIAWSQISVTVAERDVAKMKRILEMVARTNLTTLQHNLWNETYRRALLYTHPLTRGDATWHILELLSRKSTLLTSHSPSSPWSRQDMENAP